jgi:hypothetical protein
MHTAIRTPAPALRAILAVAVALTAACDGGTGPSSVASTIDFDGVTAGEQLSGQYAVLPGVEFVTIAAGCGKECPAPERWRLPCLALPTVTQDAAARSLPHVASIQWGSRDFVYNAACGRLAKPARRLQLQVRNAGTKADEVTLIGVDASGTEIGRAASTVSPGTGFAALEVSLADDRISGFALWGPGATMNLTIDDLVIERGQ